MKILFLTRSTWYSDLMIQNLYKNFSKVKVLKKKITKLNQNYDYLLCAGYQHIVGEKIFKKIKIASVNIHPGSFNNPGAGCYSYPLFNDEKFSGVTAHHMAAIPDTGKIILHKKVPIKKNDDFLSLQKKTLKEKIKLFNYLIKIIKSKKKLPNSKIKWKIKPRLQSQYVAELLNIDLKKDSLNLIENKISCANPNYPGPYINLKGKKFTLRNKFEKKFIFGK